MDKSQIQHMFNNPLITNRRNNYRRNSYQPQPTVVVRAKRQIKTMVLSQDDQENYLRRKRETTKIVAEVLNGILQGAVKQSEAWSQSKEDILGELKPLIVLAEPEAEFAKPNLNQEEEPPAMDNVVLWRKLVTCNKDGGIPPVCIEVAQGIFRALGTSQQSFMMVSRQQFFGRQKIENHDPIVALPVVKNEQYSDSDEKQLFEKFRTDYIARVKVEEAYKQEISNKVKRPRPHPIVEEKQSKKGGSKIASPEQSSRDQSPENKFIFDYDGKPIPERKKDHTNYYYGGEQFQVKQERPSNLKTDDVHILSAKNDDNGPKNIIKQFKSLKRVDPAAILNASSQIKNSVANIYEYPPDRKKKNNSASDGVQNKLSLSATPPLLNFTTHLRTQQTARDGSVSMDQSAVSPPPKLVKANSQKLSQQTDQNKITLNSSIQNCPQPKEQIKNLLAATLSKTFQSQPQLKNSQSAQQLAKHYSHHIVIHPKKAKYLEDVAVRLPRIH